MRGSLRTEFRRREKREPYLLALTLISAGSTLQGTTVGYISTDTKLNGMAVGTTKLCVSRYILDCLCSKIKSQNSTEAKSDGKFGTT